jgi:DNA-binding response OmpR family regulator
VPKVLIAEDDLMIADTMEAALVGHGYQVCGIARTVAEAVALGKRHKPDLAILDARLADGERGSDVAAQLTGIAGLGILYASGNIADLMRSGAQGHGCLAKPYHYADLIRCLEIVSALATTGASSRPFPRGFHLLPITDDGAQTSS